MRVASTSDDACILMAYCRHGRGVVVIMPESDSEGVVVGLPPLVKEWRR